MLQIPHNLEIGIELLDKQHMNLLNKFNQMLSIEQNKYTRIEIENMFSLISNDMMQHYKDEEQLQLQYNYPNYKEHKQIHMQFADEYLNIQQEFQSTNNNDIMLRLIQKIADWVLEHITNEDAKFGNYYKENIIK